MSERESLLKERKKERKKELKLKHGAAVVVFAEACFHIFGNPSVCVKGGSGSLVETQKD